MTTNATSKSWANPALEIMYWTCLLNCSSALGVLRNLKHNPRHLRSGRSNTLCLAREATLRQDMTQRTASQMIVSRAVPTFVNELMYASRHSPSRSADQVQCINRETNEHGAIGLAQAVWRRPDLTSSLAPGGSRPLDWLWRRHRAWSPGSGRCGKNCPPGRGGCNPPLTMRCHR